MPIRAGELDRRITLERQAGTTKNGLNETVENWQLIATVWAKKHDVSDRERFASGEVSAEMTTRFQIRWSSVVKDVNPKDRLICEGRTYHILGTKEIGRREGIEISAAAEAD